MTLSVVIVTYNVVPFISLCLESILSTSDVDLEIVVIDNCSADRSADYIRHHYPDVTIIENKSNKGFATACNQGASAASGEFLLFLNPDAVVGANMLGNMVSHMKTNSTVGAVGVPMYDGALSYLAESKRKLPSLSNAIGRLLKLDKIFRGGAWDYYDRREASAPMEIEALSGANIMMRRSTFTEIGGFDERFFMYGEDLDLSHQLSRHGYSIHYLPNQGLIHFKGESTAKKKYSYFHHFYRSMALYADKNIGGSLPYFTLTRLIAGGHWLFVQLIPILLCMLGYVLLGALISAFWGWAHFGEATYYDYGIVMTVLALLSTCMGLGLYASGFFLRATDYSTADVLGGLTLGGAMGLIAYGLLPEDIRFSRAVILLTAALFATVLIFRYRSKDRALPIIWSLDDEADRDDLIQKVYKGDVSVVNSLVDNFNNGVLIDLSTISIQRVLEQRMNLQEAKSIGYWHRSRGFIYDGQKGATKGYHISKKNRYRLSRSTVRHQKRVLEVFLTLILYPFALLGGRQGDFRDVLKMQRTLVGYHGSTSADLPELPPSLLSTTTLDTDMDDVDEYYALHYHVGMDIAVLLRGFRRVVGLKS